ncbi:MAG: hypothetical protein ACRDV8_08470, partial [Acidimicrobiales bacterium]
MRLAELARQLRVGLSGFDPGACSGTECATLADELSTTEKACSAARLLAASRAIACGGLEEAGTPDPVAWVARQGGTTGSDARQALELAKSLEDHPATRAALLEGAVSIPQAKEIARAERDCPGGEAELLALARGADLTRLRDETRTRRMAALRPGDLRRRQLGARRFRHWRDGLGMVCFTGALPPETGVPFVARLEREAARLHREAKKRGSTERFCAHAADSLVGLCSGTDGGAKGRVDLVVVCDLYALRRGHAHEGEPCHLLGGGPIPVEVARQLGRDAFLKVVLHDGVDI